MLTIGHLFGLLGSMTIVIIVIGLIFVLYFTEL